MRRQIRTSIVTMCIAAVVLVVAASVLWAEDPPANAPQANPGAIPSSLSLPAGFQAKDLNEQSDIRKTLATVTKHAVTKDQFSDLCDDLVKPDKVRIGKDQDRDVTKLNGRIDQIRKAWMEKYGEDFDFDNAKAIFDDRFQIVQGEVTDPAVAVVTWPVPALSGEAMKASAMERPTDVARDKTEAAEEGKLDKGRDVAIIRFPAVQSCPEVLVSMVHQLPDNWKIDIANNRTGEQLYNDLLTHLTWLGDHSSQWPATREDAYRMFAHHTVEALYGAPIDKNMGGAGAPSDAR